MFELKAGFRHALLPALITTALLSPPAVAASSPAGELTRWGSASFGTGHGQFRFDANSDAGIAADAAGNVYVADTGATQPAANTGQTTFRIQKFDHTGAFLAQTTFTAPPANGQTPTLAGLAVDSQNGRVYALTTGSVSVNACGNSLDLRTAAELWGFSTTPAAGSLPAAPGTSPEATTSSPGVFLTPAALSATSATSSLQTPQGIAVDPASGNVLIDAQKQTSSGVCAEVEVQRVKVSASGATLGTNWKDTSNSLGLFAQGEPQDTSPTVDPSGTAFLFDESGLIWRLPATFTANASSTDAAHQVSTGGNATPLDNITQLNVNSGGQSKLSVAPDSSGPYAGLLYGTATYLVDQSGNGAAAIRAQSASTGLDTGWLAGADSPGGAAFPPVGSCALGAIQVFGVAAAPGGVVYALTDVSNGTTSPPRGGQVVEFGPGGDASNCPQATASPVQASVNGTPVGAGQTVTRNQTVDLSTTLTGANPQTVKWDFGDGSAPQTVTGNDPNGSSGNTTATVSHKFAKSGTLTVTATITSDDLDQQGSLTSTAQVTVQAGQPPTAQISVGNPNPQAGDTVTFDGSGSSDPDGTGTHQIAGYHWDFGDGTTTTTTTPTVTHAYQTPGSYTASLTVTDADDNLTSQPSTQVMTVTPAAGGGNGGGGNGGSDGGSGAGTTTGGSSTPAPGGGVLGTQATSPPAVPDAELAGGASVAVTKSGGLLLSVSCPAGEATCTGTISVDTLSAVAAAARKKAPKHKKGKAILHLAGATFSVAGGQRESVSLTLTPKARTLLARIHTLRAQVTIHASDAAGATHTAKTVVTLHLVKGQAKAGKGKRKKRH